jgi:hypothetical protein
VYFELSDIGLATKPLLGKKRSALDVDRSDLNVHWELQLHNCEDLLTGANAGYR